MLIIFIFVLLTTVKSQVLSSLFQIDDKEIVPIWDTFKLTYNKTYKTELEEVVRKTIFVRVLNAINIHNEEFDAGFQTYTQGINHFSDLTDEEIKIWMGAKPPDDLKETYQEKNGNITEKALPGWVDWRYQGYVTPVVNQGKCGSCWAFSTVASLEGQYKRKTGKLTTFSPQNLLDCSWSYGNSGCKGGWMSKAFNYIQNNPGIASYNYYPYEGTARNCRYRPTILGASIKGYVTVQASDNALKDAVAAVGPISVAVYSSDRGFLNYKSGIYSNPFCSKSADHALALIGYDLTGRIPYWTLKNSWGTNWGEGGYIRMALTPNICGISSKGGFYPIL